jgi:hypothetical protein
MWYERRYPHRPRLVVSHTTCPPFSSTQADACVGIPAPKAPAPGPPSHPKTGGGATMPQTWTLRLTGPQRERGEATGSKIMFSLSSVAFFFNARSGFLLLRQELTKQMGQLW